MNRSEVSDFDYFISQVRQKEKAAFRISIGILAVLIFGSGASLYFLINSLQKKISDYENRIATADVRTSKLEAALMEANNKAAIVRANVSAINVGSSVAISSLDQQRRDLNDLRRRVDYIEKRFKVTDLKRD